jgi:excisionase family DNA binding protein
MQDEKERLTYDIVEAGRLLGLGRNASYEAAKTKQIPVIKIGRRLLVPKAALDRMLNGSGDEAGRGGEGQ